ncbi:MAG: glycerophosphodiester phosphodiesterase [Thermofilum sp. ex4484_79]|nr:MAG: glycerophosphodiester phosphodiesterase [Thermofilum sp. ex4484_79]
MEDLFINTGHRGARVYAPENTLLSFQKAYECGATAIELDLRRTKDDKIVVIHDPTIDRVSNGHGEVEKLTLAEIKKYNVDEEKIPLLEEVLEKFSGKIAFDLDVKVEGIESGILELLETYGCIDKTIITSFLPSVLEKVRMIDKDIIVGVLFGQWNKKILDFALKIDANALVPSTEAVTQSLIDKAHSNHLKVYVWVVNEIDEMVRFLKMNVDGIITDDPCLLSRVLKDKDLFL